MAEVYLAEHDALRRQVAIKVLKSTLATDETYVKRFHNEAHAAASLVHANIVQIHDVGCVDGIHFIAQEYVQGQNLQEYMTRRGPPDVKLALAIMRQVAAALQKAAAAGIVHRDIKPENIMLAHSGEVKVADFGLARLPDGVGAVNLTQKEVTMGTPLYMSPEQVEGRPLDPRSDIYSFGVTCYQMLTGHPPFRGDTTLSVAVQHLKTQPEPLDVVRCDLPPAIARIVHKMLAKDPAHRHTNARELLTELRSVRIEGQDDSWHDALAESDGALADELAQSHSATRRLAALMQRPPSAAPRRRTALAIASGVVLAFAFGAGMAWFCRPADLLADARQVRVTRQASAQQQLFYARQLVRRRATNSEEWLQSIKRFFPDADYEIRQADKDLARLYLAQDQYERALGQFGLLAELDEPEYRAFGLAGQAVVLAREHKVPESIEKLHELRPLWDNVAADVQMRQWIVTTLEQNQEAAGTRVVGQRRAMLRDWLHEETNGG
jgi:serine/threonine-protein kinase